MERSRLVVDIGSNDGSYLLNFVNQNFRVLGVEPTKKSFELAEFRGVETYNNYFDKRAVEYIKSRNMPIGFVSVNYTLANIVNLFDFLCDLSKLMDSKSILSVVTGYHPDQFSLNMFEYINHDHITYLSLESFQNLCQKIRLKILDVARFEHKGGSVQFVVSKEDSPYKVESSVSQLEQREFLLEANTSAYVIEFRERIKMQKSILHKIINNQRYRELAGVGASISTTHLCHQFELQDFVSSLFDDDPNKIGKFSPGFGIPVFPLAQIQSVQDQVPIILSWQHTKRLLNRLQMIGYSGEVLLPLPNPKILSVL
jgi:hypothetical protein